ncbi:hypothetical protein F2Q69_00052797 [Brassica cretica]|uniref:DUF223 domain-containing protein n=1 Tax=Brassica cretica TaxID=69181 RepID=A0A8S9N5L6_BRACR|nr:hypothetical protein F2Q69_00052797 [Brassica cretica]
MSPKQKIVYLDEIRPWKTAWLIEAKILNTWKPSNASFGESLEIACQTTRAPRFMLHMNAYHVVCGEGLLRIWNLIERKHNLKLLFCLIRFAKTGAFRGNLQISNGYDSSQLVFNPKAEELREAYKFHDDSMSIVETSEEGKYIVSQANNGTGQKLTGWEAVEDDTAKAKFVLLDWVAWLVIGVKAEKNLNGSLDEVEDPQLLPDCINEIVGKTYNFGVTIKKGSETFKVLKVRSVYNTLMVDSQLESMSGKGITANSASEVSILTYSDEISSKMATPSKRSVDDIVDIPDNTSTSKMRPVKNIKIEKMSSDELGLTEN